jgi:hypothetical protein
MTLLNAAGDQTLVWDEASDEMMIPIIEKKMAEGVVFFIVEPRFFGLLPPKRTELRDAEEARKHRALALRDEDFARLVAAGNVGTAATPAKPTRGARISRSAKEVAGAQSVAVRHPRGG